jgi:RNA-directed DNA polymerase
MKDRTDEEGIDPAMDAPADDAGRRGMDENAPARQRAIPSEGIWRSLTKEGNRRGGKHGDPRARTMIEEILDPENLAAAWKRVKANKGAPGIDGMAVEAFALAPLTPRRSVVSSSGNQGGKGRQADRRVPAFAREHWPRIAEAIMEGTYRPASVRRVWIPKPDGTKRPLGVPTVLDRLIQQAVAQVLGPLFEADFSEH